MNEAIFLSLFQTPVLQKLLYQTVNQGNLLDSQGIVKQEAVAEENPSSVTSATSMESSGIQEGKEFNFMVELWSCALQTHMEKRI